MDTSGFSTTGAEDGQISVLNGISHDYSQDIKQPLFYKTQDIISKLNYASNNLCAKAERF